MPSIGFRATPQAVLYAVVDGTVKNPTILAKSKLKPPAAYDYPNVLAWYREQVLHLIAEFGASACGVKTAEPFAPSRGGGVVTRHNIDGVLIEAAAVSGLPCVVGPWKTIGACIGAKKPKAYVDGEEFRNANGWADISPDYKEAALAGVAALGKVEK